MAYSPYYALWKNFPDTSTPLVAAALNNIEAGIAAATPSRATALPGSPGDGDEVILTDSLTAPTYNWHLKYVAGKASNKWVAIGGMSALVTVATTETTTSTSYAALTPAGPSFAIPVAGDYKVAIGFEGSNNTVDQHAIMSYDIGATGAVDADRAVGHSSGASALFSPRAIRLKSGLTAVTLTAKYRAGSGGGTASFAQRTLEVTPVAIGG